MKVREASKAEYLGSILNSHANPTMEINRRIAGAAFARRKLDLFRKHGNISIREKLLMYEAVVGTKLMYELDTMPSAETQLKRLAGFYFKGIRCILGWDTTYGQMQKGQQRTNTNEKLVQAVNAEFQKTTTRQTIQINQ